MCFQQGEGPSRVLFQALLLREGSLTALMLHCSKLILIDLLPLGRNKHPGNTSLGWKLINRGGRGSVSVNVSNDGKGTIICFTLSL